MIEKYRKHIEITMRVFDSYDVDRSLLQEIADIYNNIAKKQVDLIELGAVLQPHYYFVEGLSISKNKEKTDE